jgi:hypothetical protein
LTWMIKLNHKNFNKKTKKTNKKSKEKVSN